MQCNGNINQNFIIDGGNSGPSISACTSVFTNQINSCSGNTSIILGTDSVEFNSPISATTYYGDGSNLSGISTQDTYVTGFTYLNNDLTIKQPLQPDLVVNIDVMTGLTVNGSISATTYYGDGSSLSGISSQDTYITGSTFSSNTLTLTNNTGGTINTTINNFDSLIVNGTISATTYQNLPTDIYITGSTFSSNTLTLTNSTGGTIQTLIDSVAPSLQQVIDVNQTADKVQFIKPNIIAKTNFNILNAALLPNNNFFIYGNFTLYNNESRINIGEVDLTGKIVTSFSGSLDNTQVFIPSNTISTNDGIYVCGYFTQVNGTSTNRLVRFNLDGSIDTNFNIGSGFNNGVNYITQDNHGKILATGFFTAYQGVTTNSRIIRLNPDGSRDNTLVISGGSNDVSIACQVDSLDRIYVTYYATQWNGRNQTGLMRLFNNGSIDSSFNVGSGVLPTQSVNEIAIDSVGRIYLYGGFLTYNGFSRSKLVRLNEDGSLDNTFNVGTGFNAQVYNVDFFNDNSLLCCGTFSAYNGTVVTNLVKLKLDGSIDTNFNFDPTGVTGYISKTIFKDNQIYLFGLNILNYSGVGASDISVINLDGSIPTNNIIYSGGKATYNVDRINNVTDFEIVNRTVTAQLIETYDITSPTNTISIDSTIPTNTKLEVSSIVLNDINAREVSNNKVSVLTGTSQNYPNVLALSNTRIGSFGITIDGGGSSPTNGVKGYITIPYDAIITGWDIIGDTIGSCVVDVWRSNTIPGIGNTITGSEKPSLSTQQISRDDNLTTWNTIVNKNDIVAFYLESSSIVKKITLIIKVLKN